MVPRVYTTEEQQKRAEQKKQALMKEAEAIIAPLSRAVRLGMASDKEKGRLEAWERYSVLLT
ncbi:phage tail protein [Serratia odorifera]|nr:phage tail protein [Serratia odorifera]